jgi:hypothetical protein
MSLFHVDTFGGYLPTAKRKRKKNRPNFRQKKSRQPCRTKGCKQYAVARGRCMRCYQYLYRVLGGIWQFEPDLEWGKFCCFKTCDKLGQGEFAEGDFPLCKYHELSIWMLMMLEDFGYEDTLKALPIDNDWLWARFIAELREYTLTKGGDASFYRNAIGDTPLYRIFMDCNIFYLPLLHSL